MPFLAISLLPRVVSREINHHFQSVSFQCDSTFGERQDSKVKGNRIVLFHKIVNKLLHFVRRVLYFQPADPKLCQKLLLGDLYHTCNFELTAGFQSYFVSSKFKISVFAVLEVKGCRQLVGAAFPLADRQTSSVFPCLQ